LEDDGKANKDELDKEIKSIAREGRYDSRQLKLGMQWRLEGKGEDAT
jgi:hypothetical protein